LVISLILTLVDWLAAARRWKRLEYVFKPATLVAVLVGAGLLTRGPHDAWMACFFLAGDVLLMLPGERFFLSGLVAFLPGPDGPGRFHRSVVKRCVDRRVAEVM